MLVLSRRTDESIKIGRDIEISVVAIHGNRVQLGISAPTGISVWRGELNLGPAVRSADGSWPGVTGQPSPH